MDKLTIVLGNKAYSSWSLRGWLVLAQTGADYDEIVIPLRQADSRARILEHGPSGRVPALRVERDGQGLTICAAYRDSVLAWPAMKEWIAAAEAEAWII